MNSQDLQFKGELQNLVNGEEPWVIQFRTSNHPEHSRCIHVIFNQTQARAEEFADQARCGAPGREINCRECPEGLGSCPHEDTPEQRGWYYTEMTDVQIMPQREAVL